MLKKYPQMKKLFGPEPLTCPIVLALVATQVIVGHYAWAIFCYSKPLFFAVAWVVGGTINHSLFLAIHELSHHLAFKSFFANKLLSAVANIPIGIPYAATFQIYHMEHHRLQGSDGIDADIPTLVEARWLSSTVGKFLFCLFSIAFYALRPLFVKPLPPVPNAYAGMVLCTQIAAAVTICLVSGPFAYLYLLVSSAMAGALHPMSGHFIAEHYEFVPNVETYSYYGPLNWLGFNVGYHNEHHDFPFIAWTRLPQVRRIAPEYYDSLPQHPSWPGVLWNFITDPKMTLWRRVKRTAACCAASASPQSPVDAGEGKKAM